MTRYFASRLAEIVITLAEQNLAEQKLEVEQQRQEAALQQKAYILSQSQRLNELSKDLDAYYTMFVQ